MRLCEKLAKCFTHFRDQDYVEQALPVMLRQRILGIALGYEDINDHEKLRLDVLLTTACGRADALGLERHQAVAKGKPLAGKSTLNRLELGAQEINHRTKRIQANPDQIQALLLREGVRAIPRKSELIILDFDATDDRIHGNQEGRFYHGYYGDYGYLPLYCFCGDIPLWTQLRTSDRDGSEGALEALQQIILALRQRFGKHTPILVRADSGFCREPRMSWIEAQTNVSYVFGLARNQRLEELLAPAFWQSAASSAKPSWWKAKATHATSSPTSPARRRGPSDTNGSEPDRHSMSNATVHAQRRRTGSKNSSSTCLPTAPPPPT
jgi:hypothetical protein